MTLPGTTIEISKIEHGISRTMFDGIFASGGITLSQVCIMTGLEPYMVQNWVKRKFVSSPQRRVYSPNQFARIVIINMLRESLQIDSITSLLKHINGTLSDESDDLIGDSELYHMYVDLFAECGGSFYDTAATQAAIERMTSAYDGPDETRRRLFEVLEVISYARVSVHARHKAERLLAAFDLTYNSK